MRVTVTPETADRQSEIAGYLTGECHASVIRVEPVYWAGRDGFSAADASGFLGQFVQAREVARKAGATYTYAGVRMNEIHGPYCDVIRNNLRLMPERVTLNCFCGDAGNPDQITGRVSGNPPAFELSGSMEQMKEKAMRIPDRCRDCICNYHCSRGCPDYCMFQDTGESASFSEFRCNFHQEFLVHEIISNLTI